MACVLLVAGRRLPRLAVDLIAIATALGLTGLLGYLLAASAGGRIVSWAAGWSPHHGYSVGIVFVVDPLGAGIALLACCLMAVAFLYSVRYLDAVEAHYHCLMLLFLAGMIGFSLTGDLFDLFVFFELMGAAAYGLTAIVVEDESALQGGINFGIVNSLGAYFSLAGLGLLFARTGSVGLPQLHNALAHQRPNALIVARLRARPCRFPGQGRHGAVPLLAGRRTRGRSGARVLAVLGGHGAARHLWPSFGSTGRSLPRSCRWPMCGGPSSCSER